MKSSLNLLKLGLEQKKILADRIKKWNGLIRIFVHPLFEKWHWPAEEYGTHEDHERLMRIEKALSHLLSMSEEKTPPIIILEEHTFLDRLLSWSHTSAHKQEVIYVQTQTNYPSPLINSLPYYEKQLAWNELIVTLDSLGVKKILMGGMQFEADTYLEDWTGKPPHCGRCVGIAISYLSIDKAGKFNVELSTIIDSPYDREKYINCVAESKSKKITTACT